MLFALGLGILLPLPQPCAVCKGGKDGLFRGRETGAHRERHGFGPRCQHLFCESGIFRHPARAFFICEREKSPVRVRHAGRGFREIAPHANRGLLFPMCFEGKQAGFADQGRLFGIGPRAAHPEKIEHAVWARRDLADPGRAPQGVAWCCGQAVAGVARRPAAGLPRRRTSAATRHPSQNGRWPGSCVRVCCTRRNRAGAAEPTGEELDRPSQWPWTGVWGVTCDASRPRWVRARSPRRGKSVRMR